MIIMHQLAWLLHASQLNRQSIFLLKLPLTHYWSSPLNEPVDFFFMFEGLSVNEIDWPAQNEGNKLSFIHFISFFSFIYLTIHYKTHDNI